MIIILYNFG